MRNPLLATRRNKITYSLTWAFASLCQAFLLWWLGDFSIGIAIMDAAVFSFFFGILIKLAWPATRYTPLVTVNYFNIVSMHLVVSTIIISLWYLLGHVVLNVFLSFFPNGTWSSQRELRIGQGIVYYLLVVMIYYFVIFLNNQKENEARESKLKENLKQAELETLKSQLNPHFIFNSLNSISSLTLLAPEKAQEMVILLSEFLRYALKQRTDMISFENELDAIKKYIAIEKIRFDDTLKIQLDIEKDLGKVLVPTLIIQPLVENAIKYGVYESTEENELIIKCKRVETNKLEISIQNDFDIEGLVKKGEGVGLRNVRDRLEIIYGRTDLLSLNQKEGVFTATLTIPIIPKTELQE